MDFWDLPADLSPTSARGEGCPQRQVCHPGYEAKLGTTGAADPHNLKGVLDKYGIPFPAIPEVGITGQEITDVEMEDIIPVFQRGRPLMSQHIKLYPSGAQLRCETVTPFSPPWERAGYAPLNNCRAVPAANARSRCAPGSLIRASCSTWRFGGGAPSGYGLMCMAKPLSDELEIEWERRTPSPNCSRRANRSTPCWWIASPHATHHRVRTATARRNHALLAGAICAVR